MLIKLTSRSVHRTQVFRMKGGAVRRVKHFLPTLLCALYFRAAPDGEHILVAIHYLTELDISKKRILDNAPGQIITGFWKRLVYDADGRIQRAGYSLCLLLISGWKTANAGTPTDGREAAEQLDEAGKTVCGRFHSNDAVDMCHERVRHAIPGKDRATTYSLFSS